MTLLLISLLMAPSAGSVPVVASPYGSITIRLVGFLASEFRDGIPPRFVIRGIPRRIERIKPGMTYQQVHDILGLESSWLLGGTSAKPSHLNGNGHYVTVSYTVGRQRIVTVQAKVNGVQQPVGILRPRASIQLWFATDIEVRIENWKTDKATRLTRVTFGEEGKVVVDTQFKK